jgi:hypothetical protein
VFSAEEQDEIECQKGDDMYQLSKLKYRKDILVVNDMRK